MTGILTVLQLVTGIFLHANVRWRWRLRKLIITPDFHHWHHANEAGAINSNYSVFLPAWDLAFGTWFMPEDRRPQVYGIDEYMPPTMLAQVVHQTKAAVTERSFGTGRDGSGDGDESPAWCRTDSAPRTSAPRRRLWGCQQSRPGESACEMATLDRFDLVELVGGLHHADGAGLDA